MARKGQKFTLTSVLWVPRGAAKSIATRWEPDIEEQFSNTAMKENKKPKKLKKNINDTQMKDINEIDDENEDIIVKTYELDSYDEETDQIDGLGDLIGGVKGLMYTNPEDDPYITNPEAIDTEDSDDIESLVIRPTDFPLLSTVCEEDGISHLDVYLVDPHNLSRHLHSHIDAEDMNTEHLWIHHDYLLSAFPLCMAWFNFPPSFDTSTNSNVQRGNFVAVGTFEPAIEVWDLDVMDSPPCLILGGSRDAQKTSQFNSQKQQQQQQQQQQNTSNSKTGVNKVHNKGKKKAAKSTESDLVPDSHTKGVISLSWNTLQPNVLASGSADQSVKVWDLTRAACVLTLRHHDAEVQTVQWHPRDSAILSTASYDQRLRICDVRQHSNALTFSLESSPEATVWLSWSPTHLLLSDESGQVLAFDMRQPQKFLWRLGASSKPCSGLTVNHISGLLVTCSTEKDSPVKIWDIGSPDGQLGTTPSCLVSKTSDVGPAHCVSLCNDLESPFLLAVGGNHEQPHVFDLATLRSVRARWNLSGERIAHDTTNNTNINTNNKNNNMTNNNNKVEMITNVSNNNNNNNNININNINNNNNNNKSKRANKKKKK